jgi:hypothetical protein
MRKQTKLNTGRSAGRQLKLMFIWQFKSEQNSLLVLRLGVIVIQRRCRLIIIKKNNYYEFQAWGGVVVKALRY